METGNLAMPAMLDKKQRCYSTEPNNFTTLHETPQIWLKQAFPSLLLPLNISMFTNSFQQ